MELNKLRKIYKIAMVAFATIFFSMAHAGSSYACCNYGCPPCTLYVTDIEVTNARSLAQNSFDIANNALNNNVANAIHMSHCGSGSCSTTSQQHVLDEREATRVEFMDDWLRTRIWDNFISLSFRHMASQVTASGIMQTGIIGSFFDAQAHNDGQRLINSLHAEAHNDYQPSYALCKFGTGVRSLASSEYNAKITKLALNQRSLNRQMGNKNTVTGAGGAIDQKARMKQFAELYCDYSGNNNKSQPSCGFGILPIRANNDTLRIDNDIDYIGTLSSPLTLDIDFISNPTVSNDEADILALLNNLHAHQNFMILEKDELNYPANRSIFLDMRSLIAKRNVAFNSVNHIVAMKSQGSPESAQYMKKIVNELGIVTEPEIDRLLGVNPSYYAQMEVLTKKLYQNPNFYIGLIDKPANVNRQHAAIQSFRLMQKRDIYESMLRSEMLLSVLVETKLGSLHEDAENELRAIK